MGRTHNISHYQQKSISSLFLLWSRNIYLELEKSQIMFNILKCHSHVFYMSICKVCLSLIFGFFVIIILNTYIMRSLIICLKYFYENKVTKILYIFIFTWKYVTTLHLYKINLIYLKSESKVCLDYIIHTFI